MLNIHRIPSEGTTIVFFYLSFFFFSFFLYPNGILALSKWKFKTTLKYFPAPPRVLLRQNQLVLGTGREIFSTKRLQLNPMSLWGCPAFGDESIKRRWNRKTADRSLQTPEPFCWATLPPTRKLPSILGDDRWDVYNEYGFDAISSLCQTSSQNSFAFRLC